MSSFVNRFTDPLFSGTVVAIVVFSIVLGSEPVFDSYIVGSFISLLVLGGLYVLYIDYVEKQKVEAAETAKEDDLKARIAAQAAAEEQKGKCISCLTELPAGAAECPKCGFAVKHYSVEASEAPAAAAPPAEPEATPEPEPEAEPEPTPEPEPEPEAAPEAEAAAEPAEEPAEEAPAEEPAAEAEEPAEESSETEESSE